MATAMILLVAAITIVSAAQAQGLFDAIQALDRPAFDAAIASGADVNARDPFGQTPLMYAVTLSQVGMMTALIDAGADVHARSDAGWTALHYAARDASKPQVVEVLLGAGASIWARTEDGDTPEHLARSSNDGVAFEALRAARVATEEATRWLRVLGVPLPSGAVAGVTIYRRTLAPDGTLGAADDVHVWLFADRQRPTWDQQILDLGDGRRVRIERAWTLDTSGRPTGYRRTIDGVTVQASFDAGPSTLNGSEVGAGSTTTFAYLYDRAADVVTGRIDARVAGSSITSERTFAFTGSGTVWTVETKVAGARTSTNTFDEANLPVSVEASAPFTSERLRVVSRDVFGNVTQALVEDRATGRVTHQVDYVYAYGGQGATTDRTVRVITDSLRLRTAPGLSSARIDARTGGAFGTLIDDRPTWADGYWWWHVRFDDGIQGWVAHGDQQETWLGDASGMPLVTPPRPTTSVPVRPMSSAARSLDTDGVEQGDGTCKQLVLHPLAFASSGVVGMNLSIQSGSPNEVRVTTATRFSRPLLGITPSVMFGLDDIEGWLRYFDARTSIVTNGVTATYPIVEALYTESNRVEVTTVVVPTATVRRWLSQPTTLVGRMSATGVYADLVFETAYFEALAHGFGQECFR